MDNSDVVLITGANSGMGKATALALAKTGAQVVMLCRNPSRGQAALRSVLPAIIILLLLCFVT
jgi:NAD(P)-dependent dehydrogenase (short-subunit alcohol dehydrogenase family)